MVRNGGAGTAELLAGAVTQGAAGLTMVRGLLAGEKPAAPPVAAVAAR